MAYLEAIRPPHPDTRENYWVDYLCGCTADTARSKEELLEYCPYCGEGRQIVYPEYPPMAGHRAKMVKVYEWLDKYPSAATLRRAR